MCVLNSRKKIAKLANKTIVIKLYYLLLVLIFASILIAFYIDIHAFDKRTKLKSTDPVILWWTKSFPGTSETRKCGVDIQCKISSDREINGVYNIEAYLFYGSEIDFNYLPLPRLPQHILWGLFHEESPRNKPELMHEKVLSLFNFSSTFSSHSDIPFPLQYLHSIHDIINMKYFVPTKIKNSFLNDLSPILYLQSDCETSTERDAYVRELMKLIKIDSYGSCINNKVLPEKFKVDYLNNLDNDDFLNFISRYKFVLSIENGVCEDYITEKFWRAIKIGVVPIYFGSPTIRDWLPNDKSAVLVDDYPTPYLLFKHIQKLLVNNTLYEEYLKHKIDQVITNKKIATELNLHPYQRDSLQTASEFECFVCRKLHKRKEGRSDYSIVNSSHYNCPKPISVLSLQVNPQNDWVYTWELSKRNAENIYKKIVSEI